MIEAATDTQGALAHCGVLKTCSKLAAHKAAHSAVHALRAEPSRLSSRAGISWLGHAQAGWVKCPQTGALADQQLCQAKRESDQILVRLLSDNIKSGCLAGYGHKAVWMQRMSCAGTF